MIIAVDFDGTIVEHKYPKIGSEIPFATDTLKMLIKDGHQLILWSVREGELLQEAVDWCHERGVDFWAVNKDYPEEEKEKNMERMPIFNQDNTRPEDEVEDEESGVLGKEESRSDLPADGQGRKAGRPVR